MSWSISEIPEISRNFMAERNNKNLILEQVGEVRRLSDEEAESIC